MATNETQPDNRTQKTPWVVRKIIHTMWGGYILIILLTVFLFSAIAMGWIGYMPPIDELLNPHYKFASEVISSDGKVLGTYSLNKENRIYATYNEIPKSVVEALVATEDVRFFQHSGIDAKALARAFVKRGLFSQKNAGGGSTITQQLAKQLYSPSADNALERFFQKPIEWVISVKLERYYTKEEILTMYLNKYDWGYNAVGIKTAAMTYFSKDPKDLTIDESATLIGMCQNSALFNPVRRNDKTRQRRNVVLSQMCKAGFITDSECSDLQTKPLTVKFHLVDHRDGPATYFREYLRMIMTAKKPKRSDYPYDMKYKYAEDSLSWVINPLYGWCNKNFKSDGSPYNLYTDGLKIYTTIDSRMQQYAEDAVAEYLGNKLQPMFDKEKAGRSNAPFSANLSQAQIHQLMLKSMRASDRYKIMHADGLSDAEIERSFHYRQPMTIFTWHGPKDTVMTPWDSIRYYKSFLRSGLVAMNPQTGAVKAYVGGPNYAFFQYDMAMMGRRQVGSSVKPFLYSLGMENGLSPCTSVMNHPYSIGGWTPHNSSYSRYGEMVTLKWGLQQSNNWIATWVMSRLSPFALVNLIHKFGVANNRISATPSLCLGTCDISVGEMVSAYTAFINKGIRCAPMLVTKIENSDGKVISKFHSQMNEVISAQSAQNMLSMLIAVTNGGTGSRVKQYTSARVGGKTGTSQNNSDGWFVGFVPNLVTGCWVGGEDRDIHFDFMREGEGSATALPIWGIFMRKVYNDGSLPYDEKTQFPQGELSNCEKRYATHNDQKSSKKDSIPPK